MDDWNEWWKVGGGVLAVGTFVVRGLYSSGKKYTEILGGIEANNLLISQVIDQQEKQGESIAEQSQILHKHETRLAVVESKLG